MFSVSSCDFVGNGDAETNSVPELDGLKVSTNGKKNVFYDDRLKVNPAYVGHFKYPIHARLHFAK